MNCLTEQARQKIRELKKQYPNISEDILAQLFRHEQFTGIDKIPGSLKLSNLFTSLLELFENDMAAVQKTAVVLASYLNLKLFDLSILDEQGLPRLFYTTKDNKYCYSDVSQIYYDYILQELTRLNNPNAESFAREFRNICLLLKLLQSGLPVDRQTFNSLSKKELLSGTTEEFITEANVQLLKVFLKLQSFGIKLPQVLVGFYNSPSDTAEELNELILEGNKDTLQILGISTNNLNVAFTGLKIAPESYSQYTTRSKKDGFIFVYNQSSDGSLRVRTDISYDIAKSSVSQELRKIVGIIDNALQDLTLKERLINNSGSFKNFLQAYYFVDKFAYDRTPQNVLSKAIELTRILESKALNKFGILQAEDSLQLINFPFRGVVNEEFSNRFNEMLSRVQEPTVVNLVDEIIKRNDGLALVAETLLPYIPEDLKLEIVDNQWEITEKDGTTRLTCGLYDPASNTIRLSREQYAYPDLVILHELIHAITHNKIRFDSGIREEANKIFEKALKALFKKYNVSSIKEFAKLPGSSRLVHGFTNVDEFFSELWTNSKFIRELNTLGPKSKKSSLFLKIKDFLLRIIGIKETSEIYEQASEVLLQILDSDYYFNLNNVDLSQFPSDVFEILPAPPELLSLDQILKEALNSDIELNEGQLKVVELALDAYKKKSRENNIGIISGKAGTGKTTVCQEIIRQIEALNDKKLNIIVSAISNVAKNNILQKVGKTKSKVQALSVAGLLGKVLTYDSEGNEVWRDDDLRARQNAKIRAAAANLVIVDEASMLSQKLIDEIKEFCPNALILFVGDERQVRPVSEENTTIFAPIFNSDGLFKYELTDRVRLGEGSPILQVSDVYGDVSANPSESEQEVFNLLQLIFQEIEKPHLEVNSTGAIFSIPENSPEIVTEFLTPLAIQAIETGNPNLFGIIPYHRNTTTRFNNLIRSGVLRNKYGIEASTNPADGSSYVGNIPYKKGEIIFANGNIELDEHTTIDNGTKFVVKEDAIIANPEEFTIELNGNQILLNVQRVQVQWEESGILKEITLLQPLFLSENYVKAYLKQLVTLANQLKTREEARPYWKEYFSVKKQFADLKPAWALNVHRALGQTYEVTYVPADDYKLGHAEALRRGESSREALVALSSLLYTAITRASNVVMVSNLNVLDLGYTGDVTELNSRIKASKTQVETSDTEEVTTVETQERSDNVPELLLKQYDFLKFVTGSDYLFKSLNTSEGINEARNLALLFQLREAELNKLNRTFGQVTKNNSGVWDYASIIRNKNLLHRRITRDNIEQIESEVGQFPTIRNLNVKAALAVIPNLYAQTFKVGKRSLADITPEFFRTVNNYYKTKVQHTDLLVRLHNGTLNIAFSDKFPSRHLYYGQPIKPIIINGWRVDEKGNRMYQVPVNEDGKTNFVIYNIGGKETIVFKKDAGYNDARTLLFSLSDSVVSVQPFLENIDSVEEINKFIKLSNTVSRFSTQERLLNLIRYNNELNATQKKELLLNLYNDSNQEKLYSEKFANTLYNSFVKSLSITSSRIPTQALASFMNMQVAAFNPSGANDVFVSLWQLWLQGSKNRGWNL